MTTDAEHGESQRSCSWKVFLHHNEHFHQEPPFDYVTATVTGSSP